MPVHIVDKDRGWDELKTRLRQTHEATQVVVGIFGEKASADHGGKSNVEVATAHEFGLVIQHPGGTAYVPGGGFVSNKAAEGKDLPRTQPHPIPIPERSFIRGTIDAKRKEIQETAKRLADNWTAGKYDLRTALDRLGLYVKGLIQRRISQGIEPPLKAATIARKGSSKPLIDTGQLRASIDHEVRKV